ncbi:regulatory iron-sulfur-containing complex subunit RicT [Mucisphaera calidilacus]|uniref:PSP1 C-terminal domain-containing protein n=1 Tax=Mucisphaera calidilacus TaxID=2527982 RepID=A0A518BW95_9BACT|nr:regulatory iron-sulfur-containing complex subunit RicT [Mucisphaera calidilacus]QDU71252.1 hypothetical protein Pan265_11010 [Mucisphaera calidilacus]
MPGSITPLPVMLSEEDQAIYDRLETPKTIVVRYSYQRKVGEFPYDGDSVPGCGSKMIIRTDRGTEIAEMLTTTCANAGCGKSVSRKEMLEYIKRSGGKDYPFHREGRILRIATVEDLNQQARLDTDKPGMIRLARRFIGELDLDMSLVDVEPLLGQERIIFYYTSEQWVDFRELVKHLAAELHTRIEMVQVNAREEARIVADFEKCGQHCCCKQFLKVLKPVSMRSAKVQKATLDPQKISGRCGRLMCCLRYEDQTYSELKKNLPHKKTIVETEDGIGIVIDSQILTQLVLVRIGTAPPAAYPLESIRSLTKEEAADWRQRMAEEERERAEAWARRTARRTRPREEERPREPQPQDQTTGDAHPADATDGEQKKKRRRRRRRRKPDPSGGEAPQQDASQQDGSTENAEANQSDNPDQPKKKRRRRRRRRRGPGDGEQGGDAPDRGDPPSTPPPAGD